MEKHTVQQNRPHLRQQNTRIAAKRAWLKPTLIVAGSALGLFVVTNLLMFAIYRNKVLPNYSIASTKVSGIRFDQLDEKVSVDSLLPKSFELKKDDQVVEQNPQELGVTIDWRQTRERLKKAQSKLPITTFFKKHVIPVELIIEESKFDSKIEALKPQFTKAPLPERVAFEAERFVIAPPVPGYEPDMATLQSELLRLLARGETVVPMPTIETHSNLPLGTLGGEVTRLNKVLENTKVTLTDGGTSNHPITKVEIGSFYELNGQTMQLSVTQMYKVVEAIAERLKVKAVNQDEAVMAIQYASLKQLPVNFVLAGEVGTRIFHYCPSLKSVNASELFDFKIKLATVYGDPRGWNERGRVVFLQNDTLCDFYPWLSAPQQMTSFGAICDAYYSCRVGRNVVINYDRWKGATDPWNAAGGTLEDYRVMVINHETGHWLGFGHSDCPAPGQPAPVMQQQSINLQGCTFNPWPTAAELNTLKSSLGIAATHERKYDLALASSGCSCGQCTA